MIKFLLNGKSVNLEIEAETPLLWVIREHLGLIGTKYGCGASLCGACTVHVGGEAVRSGQLPVADVQGLEVTTIEGLGQDKMHPVQMAWIEANVPQCGYCQSGQIMSAAALLHKNPDPSDVDIDAAMSGNICRCGMYGRIKKAIHRAAELNAASTIEKTVRIFDPNDPLVRGMS